MTQTETALATVAPPDSSLQPATLAQLREFAETFAVSQLLPTHLRNKPADVAITVLYGRELGLTPMQAIQGIFVIEGKPGVSAATAIALVKRSPVCEYFIRLESTELRATYETKRHGEPKPVQLTFTIQDAARAELVSKGTWKKYPAAMLRNRAAMQLARDVYPDVVANVLDPDEAEDARSPGGGMVAPPAPAPFTAPAGTLEATVTPAAPSAPAQPLLERVAGAPTMAALVDLVEACKVAPAAERDALLAAYTKRKKELTPAPARAAAAPLPADGRPGPGWSDGPQPDPNAGAGPRGQVVREGGRVSQGDAKAGPAVSQTWGDIVDAGTPPAAVAAERDPGEEG